MPSTELTRAYEVPAAPAEVLAHLADPENYVGLSPLLVGVRDVRREDEVTHYLAVERFRFLGLVTHDNLIRVTLRAERGGLPEEGSVSGDVVSPGGVRMGYRFAIHAHDAGSRVVDTLQLSAPFGLLRFAAGKAAEVQAARGRVLAERLAQP
ncbi:SRPBCC family protein [Streptacidiphilus anmyonensis]|uniref:SRPBCC family protein n=1 Tax=Streptacidiphilus anmyonensis TaxID=405782 RepID=UPI0005A5FF00|nr:SRPBCC family protein [Streptacidiphilus anmyonensis]